MEAAKFLELVKSTSIGLGRPSIWAMSENPAERARRSFNILNDYRTTALELNQR